jgi:hypothetical protein
MKYAFIRAHREEFGIRAMCRVLRVHFSGFYPTHRCQKGRVRVHRAVLQSETKAHEQRHAVAR